MNPKPLLLWFFCFPLLEAKKQRELCYARINIFPISCPEVCAALHHRHTKLFVFLDVVFGVAAFRVQSLGVTPPPFL